jgi:hypothetical protein
VIVTCDAPGCVRGLVHRSGGWGDPCKLCGGAGGFTLTSLCRLLDEYEQTMSRFLTQRGRTRAKTASRILDKLLKVTAR